MVLKKLVISFVCVVCAQFAAADEQSHEAATRELLEVMETRQIFDKMKPQLDAMFNAMMPDYDLPPEEMELMDALEEELKVAIYQTVSWERMADDFLQLYMNVFNEQEIKELIDFYRTPLGRKTIEKMPLVSEQSMALMVKYSGEMDERIEAVSAKYQQFFEEQ